jgi:hypothetical protein
MGQIRIYENLEDIERLTKIAAHLLETSTRFASCVNNLEGVKGKEEALAHFLDGSLKCNQQWLNIENSILASLTEIFGQKTLPTETTDNVISFQPKQ